MAWWTVRTGSTRFDVQISARFTGDSIDARKIYDACLVATSAQAQSSSKSRLPMIEMFTAHPSGLISFEQSAGLFGRTTFRLYSKLEFQIKKLKRFKATNFVFTFLYSNPVRIGNSPSVFTCWIKTAQSEKDSVKFFILSSFVIHLDSKIESL